VRPGKSSPWSFPLGAPPTLQLRDISVLNFMGQGMEGDADGTITIAALSIDRIGYSSPFACRRWHYVDVEGVKGCGFYLRFVTEPFSFLGLENAISLLVLLPLCLL
jgi:hypothetical protein